MNILGIFHSYSDPSAALLQDDRVVSYVEEERLLRNKHAVGRFPIRAIESVLEAGNLSIDQVDFITQAWECQKYDDGRMAEHFARINSQYPPEPWDEQWQQRELSTFTSANQSAIILRNLRKHFGPRDFPEIRFVNHHLAHACTAFHGSHLKRCLILTLDGSGEEVTTGWWLGEENRLTPLHEVKIPHSIGWYYSAFTELLGFDAYDGEYKVMGLAAYGRRTAYMKNKIDELLWYDGKGGFELDPKVLAMGQRRSSLYFPDRLPEFMGLSPRSRTDEIKQIHKDCAWAVQNRLEEVVLAMLDYWIEETGVKSLAISGGVGLNVKMNGRIFASGLVEDFFVYPICNDAGLSIGGPMALRYNLGKLGRIPTKDLCLGPSYSDEEICDLLDSCRVSYTREESIEQATAELISQGKIVAWFQGGSEGGPRALGARSILADPRKVESRERVNAAIKYREPWRPFCPSMTAAAAERYFDAFTAAPFMIITFTANETAKREVPAVVHVDGTSRPQIVEEESTSRYFQLLQRFEALTGIPCLLNTSFNIKGEPMVNAPQDALRTYFATGLDALAIGSCLVQKEA